MNTRSTSFYALGLFVAFIPCTLLYPPLGLIVILASFVLAFLSRFHICSQVPLYGIPILIIIFASKKIEDYMDDRTRIKEYKVEQVVTDSKPELEKQLLAYLDLIVEGNIKESTDLMDAKLLADLSDTDRNRLRQAIEKSYSNLDVQSSSVAPSVTQYLGEEHELCLIPYSLTALQGDQLITFQSHILATKHIQGSQWRFVALTNKNKSNLETLYPGLSIEAELN